MQTKVYKFDFNGQRLPYKSYHRDTLTPKQELSLQELYPVASTESTFGPEAMLRD